ncbi:MAG: AraC family transcriptional regulator [Clostridia bacterium]|nr:AraC family transcriptional regulator [Clostridia bacterium]
MTVWDGNKHDTTNFTTDKFLQVNSCGFQNALSDSSVIRKKGRVDYHFLLIASGICEVLHKGKIHTLTAGNMILYAPCEEQQYTFKTDSTSLWCHFTGTAVNEILFSCNMQSGVYSLEPNKHISESFTEVIRRFHQPGKKNHAVASLLELIYNIKDATVYPKQQEKNYDLLLPVLTYINMNYNKHITLEQLAKKSGYSKSRFSHLFTELMGTAPLKYINKIRLNAACEMLSSTNLSIGTVALSCGFNDPLYFSRLFYKTYETTPSRYRISEQKTDI